MTDTHHDDEMQQKRQRRMYLRFAAMIATSTMVMFVLTYGNTYDAGHIQFSQERLYVALLMGGAMALVMLSFMVSMMYKSRTLNIVVVATALVVFGLAHTASRAQWFIDDELYMKGRIPHHSIAILTSERADIDENGVASTKEEAAERPVPKFQGTAAPVADTRR